MLRSEFEKEAAKHISKMGKPTKIRIKQAIDKLPAGDVKKLQGFIEVINVSKETLKGLIDLIDDADMETIFRVLVRFVPEDKPLPDEVESIGKANKSIAENGTILYDEIDWDQSKKLYKSYTT